MVGDEYTLKHTKLEGHGFANQRWVLMGCQIKRWSLEGHGFVNCVMAAMGLSSSPVPIWERERETLRYWFCPRLVTTARSVSQRVDLVVMMRGLLWGINFLRLREGYVSINLNTFFKLTTSNQTPKNGENIFQKIFSVYVYFV